MKNLLFTGVPILKHITCSHIMKEFLIDWMKEKLMIIIENFLNLFSDWEFFFIKLGKNRVFCIGTGAYYRPLRYTEKIPVALLSWHQMKAQSNY